MSLDPLTLPIWEYLKELIAEVRDQKQPVHFLEEYEWVMDRDGNVHKSTFERPYLGFAFAMHKDKSTLYAAAATAINQDADFAQAIGSMVGDEAGQMRFDLDVLIIHGLQAITNRDGSFSVRKEAISRKITKLRSYLTAPTTANTLLIPLPGIKCHTYPFVIEEGIVIDQFSPKEVGYCVDSGVLKLVDSTIPVIWGGDCAGIRIQISSKVKIDSAEALSSSSQERINFINEETRRIHKFGTISRWQLPECIEDLLFVLRLSRPEFIGTEGAVLVSERPTGTSRQSVGRKSRHFVTTTYQIDSSTGRKIRAIWRDLKAQSSKSRGLPSICIRRFNAANDRVSLDDSIIDYLIAAEALFLRETGSPEERGELSYRLSLRLAKFLETDPLRRKEIYSFIKFAYAQRSYVAHGGPSRNSIKIPGNKGEIPTSEFVDKLSEVMRNALQKAISIYSVDSTFGSVEYWDSLILKK